MNRISAVCWSVLRIGVPFDTYGSGSADPALFYTDPDHFSGSGSATLILIIFLLFLVRSPAGRYLAYGGGGLWSGVLLRGGRDCLLSARDDHAGQPHEGGGGGGEPPTYTYLFIKSNLYSLLFTVNQRNQKRRYFIRNKMYSFKRKS